MPNARLCDFSLLELAFGWPKGVHILLELGADACQELRELTTKGNEYHESAMLLLKAGCLFSLKDIDASDSCDDYGKRRILLIHELADRRRRLWALAQAFVSMDQLPAMKDETLLDTHACSVFAALAIQKGNNFPSL